LRAPSRSRCVRSPGIDEQNAGEDAAVILNPVKAGKGSYGYDAATGEYGDMLDEGILDPAKVTRLALQNAASVAGLLLTTEVMIAEAPKDESGHVHPAPGGMGGMDMQRTRVTRSDSFERKGPAAMPGLFRLRGSFGPGAPCQRAAFTQCSL
jgi:hypothetical protein